MRKLKILVSGVVIGLLVGLWFGFNIGKGRVIYANPFTDPQLSEQARNTGERAVEESGEALQRAGESLQKRTQEE